MRDRRESSVTTEAAIGVMELQAKNASSHPKLEEVKDCILP